MILTPTENKYQGSRLWSDQQTLVLTSFGLSTSLHLLYLLVVCLAVLNWFSGINHPHSSNFLVSYAVELQFGLRSSTILHIFWNCLIRVTLNLYFMHKADEF